MSLHQLANHMAAHGRGPDDQLVHMSGNEVAGLQALAKSQGGSLTINPETGLAEAGFLDRILPMALGAGAVYLSGGAITPMMAGLGVGGLQTMRTGDLGKGLMAGLGAYGGAGMTGNLAGVGESMVGADMSMADKLGAGFDALKANPEASMLGGSKMIGMAAAPAVIGMMQPQGAQAPAGTEQMIRPYTFSANPQTQGDMVGDKPMIGAQYAPGQDTSERMWFQPEYTALTPYKADEGGLMSYAGGGPVEQMSNANAIGQNTGYPQADIGGHAYATPWQTPMSQNVVHGAADTGVNPMTGEQNSFAGGGGISSLGSYSDGGRLLKGPGDGMSDNIPAKIGAKQPARLADGEFVVPADVVSHLGNGSTDAGAKQLYKMMDKIRHARTGRKAQGKQINPNRFVPA